MNMSKWMSALALALVASRAFGQAGTAAVTPMTVKAKHEIRSAGPNAGPLKVLRDGIKKDKEELVLKVRASRGERKQLFLQQRAELEKVKETTGTRADKKAARRTVAGKYAKLMKDAREKLHSERQWLREDIKSKHDQIQKLRQS